MKEILMGVLCLLLISANAQDKKDALKESIDQLHKAMLDADESALVNLTIAELTYGHSGGLIEDKNAFVENLVSGNADFETMDISDLVMTLKEDVAWARCVMDASVVDGGERKSVVLKILYVWTLDDGDWKLLARQAVK